MNPLTGLQPPQRSVTTIARKKLIMGAALHNTACLQQVNAIGLTDGGQAVSNHDGGAATADNIQGPLYGRFGLVVCTAWRDGE